MHPVIVRVALATLAAANAAAATPGATVEAAADAPSAPRRGNVLTLRKTAPRPVDQAPPLDPFVRQAAAGDAEALFRSFDELPVRVNGEAAIRHFIANEVVPFFAGAVRVDATMRITSAGFEDGSEGSMAYAYVLDTQGRAKPFVIAWRGGAATLRVVDLQLGRCVAARHPVGPGRCGR